MNTRIGRTIFWLSYIFTFVSLSTVMPAKISHAQNENIITIPYSGQDHILCNNQDIKLPKQFPFVSNVIKGDNFLKISDKCTVDNFTIEFSYTKDCSGQHDCNNADFSKIPINSKLKEIINNITLANPAYLNINENIFALYTPSTCAAYCNKASLIWEDSGYLFILETNQFKGIEETKKELLRSAKTYIE